MASVGKSQIDIEVVARDLASKTLEGVKKSINGIDGSAKGGTGSLKDMAGAVFLGNMATKAFDLALQGARKGIELLSQSIKAGADLERLKVSTEVLGKNMGVTTDEINKMVKGLEEVNTYGTSAYNSIYSLMRTGLMPMVDNLKIVDQATGKTTKGFDAFVLTAKELGASLGVSSQDAIEAVNTSLIKMNDEGLRQLGIELNLTEVYGRTAKALERNVSELTAAERRQALLNEIMKEGQKVAGSYEATYNTVGKQLLSLKDNMKSTMEVIGLSFTPVAKVFTKTALDLTKKVRETFIDLAPQIEGTMKGIAEKLGKVINAESIWNGLVKIKDLIAGYFELMKSGNGKSLAEALGISEDSNLIKYLLNVRDYTQQIGEIFKKAFGVVQEVWNNVVKPAFEQIKQVLNDALGNTNKNFDILTMGAKILAYAIAGIVIAITALIGALMWVVAGVIRLSTFFQNLTAKMIEPFIKAKEEATNAWNFIWDGLLKPIFDQIGQFINGLVIPVVKNFVLVFKLAFEGAKQSADIAWKGILKAIQPVIDWINKNVMPIINPIAEGMKKAFQGVSDFMKGLWDGIKNVFKSGINWIIDKINGFVGIVNGAIDAYNGAISSVPGASKITYKMPEVPKLATGTNYVPQDMLAVIHKGEKITPAKYNPDNPSATHPQGGGITVVVNGNIYGIDDFERKVYDAVQKAQATQNRLSYLNIG